MKTHRFFIALLVLTLALGMSRIAIAASGGYAAKLISPTLGQVLYPGQQVRIEWTANIPKTQAGGCEMEIFLSVDGGRSFTLCVTPYVNPKTTFFDWTVPNTPTNAAMLDIRFGCEVFYPESRSPQTASPFVIMQTAALITRVAVLQDRELLPTARAMARIIF